jgi:hypothetical protein
MKECINTKDTAITNLTQLTKNLKNKFFYFKCSACGQVKSKKYINSKIDLICGHCKSKQTKKLKYGNENYNNSDKHKCTCLEKYGFTSAAMNETVKDKQRNTIRNKEEHPGPEASHQKFLKKRLSEIEKSNLTWLDKESFRGKYSNGPIYYNFKCNICGNVFKDDFHSGQPICRVCNPNWHNTSKAEKEIVDFLKSFYNGTIIENDRDVLSGKELDIFLPEKNIAIEYNGTHWHGFSKDTNISLQDFKKKLEEKRLLCEEKNIRLITIDEADYNARKQVFQNFLKYEVTEKKIIQADKIKEIDLKTANNFLEKNSVEGVISTSDFCLGLELNSELIAVLVFLSGTCVRHCSKFGYEVINILGAANEYLKKSFEYLIDLRYHRGTRKTDFQHRYFLHKKLQSIYYSSIDEQSKNFCNMLSLNATVIFNLGHDLKITTK